MDRILRVLLGGGGAAVLAAMLATGSAGALSAGEASAWPQPALTDPAHILTRLAPADNPAADALAEMPMADTPEAKDAERPAEVASSKASPQAATDTEPERSLQLEQVAQQADRQTRHGFELAGRGAYFAARAEFLGALRLVAEGLDTEQKTSIHVRALAAALTAMKEAEDFLPGGSRVEADIDLPGIVAVHATPVLKNDVEKATPLTALRSYLTFAQQQFAAAAGREVAGSMALHALGKLHVALAQKKGTPVVAPESKAMVFYQAALLVQPKNYMAANDLGVLLAQCGRYDDARSMLKHSVALSSQPTGWRNLAVVYQQQGQTVLANQAVAHANQLGQGELARRKTSPVPTNDHVRWVDPQTFAQSSLNTPNAAVVTALPPVAKPQTAGTPSAAPNRAPIASAQPLARPVPAADEPAPTPAAAQRRLWASPTYDR